MAQPSVKIVKSMDFKGGTRLWSNRYHFSGGTPADGAHWDTLFDAIVTAEKASLLTSSTIVEALGYAAGSDVAVRTKNYTTVGTHTATGLYAPGEVAALVRYSTAARSSKNHPIYGFSYYHHVDVGAGPTNMDNIAGGTQTAMQTYASAWISGFSDGTNTYVRCTPAGHICTGSIVDNHVTHRDFPYTRSV
jgi:hypothetical protein